MQLAQTYMPYWLVRLRDRIFILEPRGKKEERFFVSDFQSGFTLLLNKPLRTKLIAVVVGCD